MDNIAIRHVTSLYIYRILVSIEVFNVLEDHAPTFFLQKYIWLRRKTDIGS